MTDRTQAPPAVRRIATLVFRLIAAALGAAHLLPGLLIVVAVGIGYAWSGGIGSTWVAAGGLYLLLVALLSFVFAVVPGRRLGGLLLLLYIPGAWAWNAYRQHNAELRGLSETYSQTTDPQAAAEARRKLQALGRRAGPQPHVQALVAALSRAENDTARVRIVNLLGRLSYQYEPVLEALRELRAETQGDPGRAELHDAATAALLGVNPYEPLFGRARDLTLDAARATEEVLARELLDGFFDRVDASIGTMSPGIPQLADWNEIVDGADWVHGGKRRVHDRISYSRTREGKGRADGTCRIDILASPADRPVEIPDAYAPKALALDVASHRVVASAITGQPELPELERRILDVVRAAAADAERAWSARPRLPADPGS